MKQRYSLVLPAALALLLACQLWPRPTPLSISTATPIQVQALTPTVTAAATATPTPTLPPTPQPTLTVKATALPPLPAQGDLPAMWTEIELSRLPGDIYLPGSLVLDEQEQQLYVLGQCELNPPYTEGGPPVCLSVLDLETDQVRRRVIAPGHGDAASSFKMRWVDGTLYLSQPWAGNLYLLDGETLTVTTSVSNVVAVADDGQGQVYAVGTNAITRMFPEHFARYLETTFSDMPKQIEATPERIYVQSYESLRIFDTNLELIAQMSLREAYPRDMALSPDALYIGCAQGIFALDLETDRLGPLHPLAGGVQQLVFDPTDSTLYALVQYPTDWFSRWQVWAINTQTWQTRTLYSTQEGWLVDLVLDSPRGRLLLLSLEDHALIPLDLETGDVAARLPLGIEVGEAIVDEPNDRLYVSASDGWVRVLNRRTYAEVGRVYGGRFISLDAAHERLYTGDPRMPAVTAWDTCTLKPQLQISQPGRPRANAHTGEVVIITRRFQVFDGQSGAPHPDLLPGIGVPPETCPGCYYTIARQVIVDAQRGLTATLTYTPWPGKPGPQESVVYDPATGRAWYALLTGGYVHYSSIALYPDLAALQKRTRPGGSPPIFSLEGLSGYLALDVPARRLYVTRGRFIFVLNSDTLQRIGVVDAGNWMPQILAVDGELGRLYAPRGSRLAVWTRQGGASPAALPPAPAVLTHTVTSILPSPNLAQDQTILATINSKLCRSTDGGRTWMVLRGGLPDLYSESMSVSAAFSPNYAQDKTIWAGVISGNTHGEGIWQSTDGGNTWRMTSEGLYDLRVYRIVPSPRFAADRTLLAYSYTQQGSAVYRSTNGGMAWQLVVRQTGYNMPPLPRPEEFFIAETYPPQFQCNYDGTCRRSDDGGQIWMAFDTGPVSLGHLVDYALSPQFDEVPIVYFLSDTNLYRYWGDARIWEVCTLPVLNGRQDYTEYLTDIAVAALGPTDHVVFIGSYRGEFLRFAASELTWQQLGQAAPPTRVAPTLTPTGVPATPTPCVGAVDERFRSAFEAAGDRLGCAMSPAIETVAAVQPFEVGLMLWRSDERMIYVLIYDGTWRSYADTWDDSLPDHDPDIEPPINYFQPVRGFGKVWREQLGGTQARIGWATAEEQGFNTLIQSFTNGILFNDGLLHMETYVLYSDGTWETVSLPWP